MGIYHAGVYASLSDGLSALEDDTRICFEHYRSAAKRAGSTFGSHLSDVSPRLTGFEAARLQACNSQHKQACQPCSAPVSATLRVCAARIS